MLDRITGAPFPQLFELIALPENVVDAIVHRKGPHVPFLHLIEAIERSDPIGISRQLDALAVPVGACNQALLKALAAANTLDSEM
jgi:EAL and modified HD-GYP domain-containing signal transduction protein